MIIFKTLISIILIVYITIVILEILSNIKYIKYKVKGFIQNLKITNKLDEKLLKLRVYTNASKRTSGVLVVLISLVLSIIIFILSIIFIKIPSTSLIISIIFLFIPYIIINIYLNTYVQKIKTILPSYIVNLKSNIEISNDIIKALNITKVEEPLRYSIDRFNEKVKRGINVYKCFDELKDEINIEIFSSLIDAFKVCYANGGEYTNILNKYIDIASKQNIEKAKIKEESSSTILTLIIMVVINIFLLFSVVLGNSEYRRIILDTIIGHAIINFGIISYVIILYFVYKIYKMEE